ncbi:hypothetical protein DPR02_32455 [Burkholderia cepacia]|uniref:Uncharacterized protein n=1 Tax=Burkholderia cepacia TaxID=292 RepID=A0AAQ0F6E7_BURCE|nr:hypothetical protein DPR02_32455 [Burkholderia cepacia]
MSARKSIAECLIGCRNFLLGGRTNEHVLPCLHGILADINLITVLSTRRIVERCVAEAIDQVKGGNFVSAGWILNLVHNLPLDEMSERRWDIDYFLSMELPTFLDHFEEIRSARKIALYVCKQLACQYLSDG